MATTPALMGLDWGTYSHTSHPQRYWCMRFRDGSVARYVQYGDDMGRPVILVSIHEFRSMGSVCRHLGGHRGDVLVYADVWQEAKDRAYRLQYMQMAMCTPPEPPREDRVQINGVDFGFESTCTGWQPIHNSFTDVGWEEAALAKKVERRKEEKRLQDEKDAADKIKKEKEAKHRANIRKLYWARKLKLNNEKNG